MILHLDSSVAKSADPNPVTSSGISSRGAGRSLRGEQDSIQISGASATLNQLAADRMARIKQLTAAVQNGSYRVSGAAVASAIVGHSLSGES